MMRRAARPVLYLGIVAAVLGLAKIHARYIGHYVLHSTQPSRLAWTIGYIGLLLVASYGSGLPDLPRTPRQAVTASALAPAIAAGGVSLLQLIVGDALLPRFVVFGAVLVLVPWNLLCTAVAHGGRVQSERRDRVVLVSVASEAELLREELDVRAERPAVIAVALTPHEARSTGPKSKPLLERVIAENGTVVVLDRAALGDETVVQQAASLHEAGVRVRTLSLFYEQWLGKLPVSELERVSLLFDIREVHGSRYGRVKRIFDVALGLVGLVALIVTEPFVLVGNLFGNRGPLLYRQERIGKNGKRFEVLKFRTMRPGGASVGTWTQADDPRITPFGRVLRKTHIDELPQLWNILFGDLSIVGPRPEQPHYVEELSAKLPFYGLRHLVRPGLTGWAQVKYGYGSDDHDAMEKLQYDFWYLRHQSLALDTRIIGRTVRSVLGREGAGR
jgi:exopolysaccharide biosynthesis polyprenyl glycosylphosphotransferase